MVASSQTCTKVGRAQIRLSLLWLLLAVFLGLVLKVSQLLGTVPALQSAHLQLITVHGLIMMFLVASPALHGGFGNLLLPRLLGLPEIRYPRLASIGFLMHAIAAPLLLFGAIAGGFRAGWMVSASDLAALDGPGARIFLAAVVVLQGARAADSVNFLCTAFSRSANRRLTASPFAVALLSISAVYTVWLVGVLALLICGSLGVFVNWGELYAGVGRPSVYLLAPAGIGIFSEILLGERLLSQRLAGWISICLASMGAMGAIRFALMLPQVLTPGGSDLAGRLSAELMGSLALPLAVAGAVLVAPALGKGLWTHALKTYLLTALLCLAIGISTGLYLLIANAGVQERGTYFLVAHFHMILIGTNVASIIAALLTEWRLIFPGRPQEKRELGASRLFLGGALIGFLPMFAMGILGISRHQMQIVGNAAWLGALSLAGVFLLALGLVLQFSGACFSLIFPRRRPSHDKDW